MATSHATDKADLADQHQQAISKIVASNLIQVEKLSNANAELNYVRETQQGEMARVKELHAIALSELTQEHSSIIESLKLDHSISLQEISSGRDDEDSETKVASATLILQDRIIAMEREGHKSIEEAKIAAEVSQFPSPLGLNPHWFFFHQSTTATIASLESALSQARKESSDATLALQRIQEDVSAQIDAVSRMHDVEREAAQQEFEKSFIALKVKHAGELELAGGRQDEGPATPLKSTLSTSLASSGKIKPSPSLNDFTELHNASSAKLLAVEGKAKDEKEALEKVIDSLKAQVLQMSS